MLDRLLPEDQIEIDVYKKTKVFLINLSKNEDYLNDGLADSIFIILSALGYVHEKKPLSELINIVEETIHEKMPAHTYE